MRIGLVLTLMALATVPCFARFGETIDQCVSRYGQAVPGATKTYSQGIINMRFSKGNILIDIDFYNGKACSLSYSRTNLASFDEEEIRGLLAAESDGKNWTKIFEQKPAIEWKRDDGLKAMFFGEFVIIITSKQGEIVSSLIKQQVTKNALNGF